MTQRDPQTGGGFGLQLPPEKDLGIAQSTVRAAENAWSTIEKVRARMDAFGLSDNPEPRVECPVVTAEALLSPDYKAYSTVFAAQLQWYNYTVRLLADVRAVLLEVDNAMTDIASSQRQQFRKLNERAAKADKIPVNEMDDRIEQDPAYKTLKLQKQQLDQERILLDAKADTLERNLKTVSRQIENRKVESGAGNRDANMPGAASGRWEQGHQRPYNR